MTDFFKEAAQIRVFFGFQLPVDLKISLSQNHAWQSAAIDRQSNRLEIVRNEGKEYIGCHLLGKMFTLKTLRDEESRIKKVLTSYLPDCSLDHLISIVFPHTFVG